MKLKMKELWLIKSKLNEMTTKTHYPPLTTLKKKNQEQYDLNQRPFQHFVSKSPYQSNPLM